MFFVGRVDPVAPLPRLLIQVRPTGEAAARQEVVLDEPEVALYAGGTIGVAPFMSHEAEAETFGKSRHLGHRNHRASGAAQHHHMGVVDHDALGERR